VFEFAAGREQERGPARLWLRGASLLFSKQPAPTLAPRAGPTGGAGLALPAGSASLIMPVTAARGKGSQSPSVTVLLRCFLHTGRRNAAATSSRRHQLRCHSAPLWSDCRPLFVIHFGSQPG
jgi:hypothetical protein